MSVALFTKQNLGVFSSDLPLITEAIEKTPPQKRTQIGRFALLDLQDDPTFQSDGQFKTIYYCVSIPLFSGEFSVFVAARGDAESTQMIKEQKALDRLRGIAFVLQPLLIKEHGSHVYLISELCNQGDLYSFILNPKRDLRSFETHWVGYLLVQAVKECHARGIVLRDLKPENVLVTLLVDGTLSIRLIDFGLAFIVGEDSADEAVKTCGSPGYVPPDDYLVIRKTKLAPPATYFRDYWPLGSTLYSLATRSMLSNPILNAQNQLVDVSYRNNPQESFGMFDREIRNLTYADKSERLPLETLLANMRAILFRFFPRAASEVLPDFSDHRIEIGGEEALQEYLLSPMETSVFKTAPKVKSFWQRIFCCRNR